MLAWSDLDGSHGPAPADGDALRLLLSTAFGRTLVAGPHAPQLLAALSTPDVTVLVRGDADATAYPGVKVLCGSLEKLATPSRYDTVIALDGPTRLHSAESPPFTWAETLAQLLALLKPDGRLLLVHENLLGVHRLTALPPTPTDADWVVPDDHDPARPAGHAQLLSHLTAAGLRITRDYSVFPRPSSPSVLLSGEVLAVPEVAGALEAAVTTAFRTTARADSAPSAPGVLADPAPSVPDMVGDSALSARDMLGDSAPSAPDMLGGSVPSARDVLADPARLAAAALRHGLGTALAPAWIVVADRGAPPQTSAPGAVINATPLDVTALPPGRTLAGHLLAAAQRRDLPTMRELLTVWQSDLCAGVPADQVIVGPRTVPAAGTPAGISVSLTAPAPAGEPLEALRAFAAEVIAGGYAHLWPGPADEAELTAVLAGMTGRDLDPADVPPIPAATTHVVGDLLAGRERLTRELAEARAKHDWYEKMLLHREAELKRVRRMNALLSATAPGKAAAGLVGRLRAGKRAVRRFRNR
ncbi:hypothetical protein [Paractinoplanes brasiliensis]|nr:hypothetical protein [Actinoplanes brasiliensis]GID27825.1 hypothetical protein Abr02nite_28080 [Actinoplanes brasiliensis]